MLDAAFRGVVTAGSLLIGAVIAPAETGTVELGGRARLYAVPGTGPGCARIADPRAPRCGSRGGGAASVTKGVTMTTGVQRFTEVDAERIGAEIGIEWRSSAFDVEQFRMGLEVELEHGARDPATDVTHDDPVLTGKIAWAHLKELPDYYTRLAVMEREAEA